MKKLKTILLVVCVVVLIAVPIHAKGDNDLKISLLSKNDIEKFYQMNGEEYFETVPTDISKKYEKTIKKLDKELIKMYGVDAIISENSSYNNYIDNVKLSIMLDSDNDVLKKEIKSMILESESLIVAEQRISPPATIESSVSSKEFIGVSLNANGYDVDDALAYAHLWCENNQSLRNSDYDFYAGLNDCTNFVSQVLYEGGGIAMIHINTPGFDYNDPDNWYYEDGKTPSYSWGGAQNLYDHLDDYSTNVQRIYSTADLEVGDIINWDTSDDGNFHIGHSTVVTEINGTSWSDILLTYHTTDREDYAASNLISAGYAAYAWSID